VVWCMRLLRVVLTIWVLSSPIHRGLSQGIGQSGAAGIGTGGSGLIPNVLHSSNRNGIWNDVPSGDLTPQDFNNYRPPAPSPEKFKEPVTDAVNHLKDNPKRVKELGYNSVQDLQKGLDHLVENGQVWTRPGKTAAENTNA
jgi:hypothetical protein